MDNPEKLSTLGTQDEDKHNKNKTCCWTPLCTQKKPQIMEIRHEPSYKQLELKMNRTYFYAEIVTDITTWTLKHKDT